LGPQSYRVGADRVEVMGQGLPRAVESVSVERNNFERFKIGVSEMNGWRNDMEDAHSVVVHPHYGFFAVLDGHGGDQCSKYAAGRLTETLKEMSNCPDDQSIIDLVLKIDQDFLDQEMPSGSTATFSFVQPPKDAGGKWKIIVGNAGDSRVLLGKMSGEIFDGPGTDKGLTTDHKPDNPSEIERIERTGGSVEIVMGVARVNGDLAVSRGFGDKEHKKTGGPSPADRPVTAWPEIGHFEADQSDFLVLVCDGVSEGQYPNAEVIQTVAEELKDHGDPGQAATAVIRKALDANSKDNISCMVVTFQAPGAAQKLDHPEKEFIPGPYHFENDGFRKAYEAMAKRSGETLASACEKRYDMLQAKQQEKPLEPAEKEEFDKFQESVPVDDKAAGKTDAFQEWAEKQQQGRASGGPGGLAPQDLLQGLQSGGIPPDMIQQLMRTGQLGGAEDHAPIRKVRTPSLEVLKSSVEAHESLTWEESMSQIADSVGDVLQDDPSDNTSKVRFQTMIAWIPTEKLIDESE